MKQRQNRLNQLERELIETTTQFKQCLIDGYECMANVHYEKALEVAREYEELHDGFIHGEGI